MPLPVRAAIAKRPARSRRRISHRVGLSPAAGSHRRPRPTGRPLPPARRDTPCAAAAWNSDCAGRNRRSPRPPHPERSSSRLPRRLTRSAAGSWADSIRPAPSSGNRRLGPAAVTASGDHSAAHTRATTSARAFSTEGVRLSPNPKSLPGTEYSVAWGARPNSAAAPASRPPGVE